MNGKSKGSANFGATVTRGSGLGLRGALRGLWMWEAFGPFRILDPAKFARILSGIGIASKPHIYGGMMWREEWLSLRSHLHAQHSLVLQPLERLVVGGDLLWSTRYRNLIVNTGLDDMLDKYFKGSAYTAAHYVGLTDSTPTVAAGDTMASHVGWTEVTAYSEAVRQTYTPGSVSSQSVDNSASKAAFSINATTTVGGGFLTTNSTKGGTSGTLIAAGAFNGGDKSLGSGDTLSITATFTQADDGV